MFSGVVARRQIEGDLCYATNATKALMSLLNGKRSYSFMLLYKKRGVGFGILLWLHFPILIILHTLAFEEHLFCSQFYMSLSDSREEGGQMHLQMWGFMK